MTRSRRAGRTGPTPLSMPVDCVGVHEWLSATADGEPPAGGGAAPGAAGADRRSVDAHLASCPGCRQFAEGLARIARLAVLPVQEAPPSLRAAVHAEQVATGGRPANMRTRRRRRPIPRWVPAAAPAAAMCIGLPVAAMTVHTAVAPPHRAPNCATGLARGAAPDPMGRR